VKDKGTTDAIFIVGQMQEKFRATAKKSRFALLLCGFGKSF